MAKGKSGKGSSPRKDGDKPLKEKLRRFIRAKGAEFLKDPNITSIGVGRKNGDGQICLQFTVGEKGDSAIESLGSRRLPETITVEGEAIPTDVLRRDYAPSFDLVAIEDLDQRRSRQDPLSPGYSVSHIDGSAGTIGLVVYDRSSGVPCILSNWHVLDGEEGEIGDRIVQPGPFDDSNTSDNGCGSLLRSHLGAAGDCALARIRDRSFDREVYELGVTPQRMAKVDLDDRVIKSGRTTGVTYGTVRRIDVMTSLNYGGSTGTRDIGCFEIGIDEKHPPQNGEISQGGDSGSAWLIADGKKATDIFAGLHFAGESQSNSDEHALACYPKSVQQKLDFQLDPPAAFVLADDDLETVVPRSGYDLDFLGLAAPMPGMSRSIKIDAVNFGRSQTIPYTHFSVCLSAARRLARFVAWNVDGAHRVVLGSHGFRTDDRVERRFQFDNSIYEHNKLDRGHIARRADLAWGPIPEAKQANRDSFFYTNIAPQHERFNQSSRGGLWGRLENLILEQADTQDIRVSAIGGPIFGEDDPLHRGAKIPREFWKLISYRAHDGALTASAFILSQNDLVHDIEAIDLDPFRLFQVTAAHLGARTELGFEAYADADVLLHPERATSGARADVIEIVESEGAGRSEVMSAEDLMF